MWPPARPIGPEICDRVAPRLFGADVADDALIVAAHRSQVAQRDVAVGGLLVVKRRPVPSGAVVELTLSIIHEKAQHPLAKPWFTVPPSAPTSADAREEPSTILVDPVGFQTSISRRFQDQQGIFPAVGGREGLDLAVSKPPCP